MSGVRAAVRSAVQSIASESDAGTNGVSECIGHLQCALNRGQKWYIALLETMAQWALPEENWHGRHYRYLIGGEAFDWLLLAERLLLEVDDSIGKDDKNNLLFLGRWPEELTHIQFRRLLGADKYRGYLNYWYGVLVEEALMLSVEDEIRKENHIHPDIAPDIISNWAFERIYGKPQDSLWVKFCEGRIIPHKAPESIDDLKEFTYWLFRWRLVISDGARLASDTRKGMRRLYQLREYSIKRVPMGSRLLW